MSITATTPVNIVLGPGNLEVGGIDVGATEGPTLFRVEATRFEPDLNGALAGVVGTVYNVNEVPYMEVTVDEITAANIQLALPGISAVSDASSETISGLTGPCIAETAHKDVVLTVPICAADGTSTLNLVVTVKNALAEGNLEMAYQKDGNTKFKIVFKGYVSSSTPAGPTWTMLKQLA